MEPLGIESVDIPEIRLVKVGKDRERKRKRGAGGWLNGGRGATSPFAGATGGTGAGAMLGSATTLTKVLVMLLATGVISASAWQFGKALSRMTAAETTPAARTLFAERGRSDHDDATEVIKTAKTIPNSIAYVFGSVDGLTPEERSKKAAEEEAVRKAADAAQKKSDDDAQKADATKVASEVPTTVPTGDSLKKMLSGGKFGSLSTGFGGGSALSGGSGLSGGINRNFAAASSLGQKSLGGSLGAFRSATKPATTGVPHANIAKSNAKGFAMRQLGNTVSASRQAAGASTSESAAAGAAAPFENNAAAGTVVSGPGMTSGATTGAADSTPATSNSNSSSNSSCTQSGYQLDSSGNCVKTAATTSTNAASYQSLIDSAKILMAVVSALALIALLMQGPLAAYQKIISMIIMGIGAVIVALGAAIYAMSGDKMMGGIVAAVGTFTIASAFLPSILGGTGATAVAEMAAGTLISNALGALAASSMSASQLQ